MRRIILVLAAAAIVAVLMVVSAAPALAQDQQVLVIPGERVGFVGDVGQTLVGSGAVAQSPALDIGGRAAPVVIRIDQAPFGPAPQ